MIKVKTKKGHAFIDVLNILSAEQDEKENVRIYCTNRKYTDTTEEFDVVINKIEKMLIRISGGVNV